MSTGTACSTPVCGANDVCALKNASKGLACTDHNGSVCDGNGHCALSTCIDGTKDGDETGVDCGGSCPTKCGTNQGCVTGADCASGVCVASLCVAPTCSDGVQNGTETDVDCGGSCPPCADTKHCTVNADCATGHCFGYEPGTCVSCMDGVKDGNETDVDCGGTDCDLQGKVCDLGKGCAHGYDCATRYCPSGTCAEKPNGQPCTSDGECASGACVGGTLCCATACTKEVPSSCGTTGLCVADGASCAVYGAGVSCGAPACSGGAVTTSACDGAGNCVASAPKPCPGFYACASATTCAASCGDDVGCAAGHTCDVATHTCT
jgi:hypothetical protein